MTLEPARLYIHRLSTGGWKTARRRRPARLLAAGAGLADGLGSRRLRGAAREGDAVGDITIGGVLIDFGGQIADFVTIELAGLACRFGPSTGEPMTARKKPRVRTAR